MDQRSGPEPLLTSRGGLGGDVRPSPAAEAAAARRRPGGDAPTPRSRREPLSRRRALAALLGLPAAAALAGLPRRTAAAPIGQGGLIVVPRNADLALVRADGLGEGTLLSLDGGALTGDAAWSPDGSRTVFSRYTPTGGLGGADLVVVAGRPEAGRPTVLVGRDGDRTLLGSPAWAPGGVGVAFEHVDLSETSRAVERIEWVAADGSGRRTLVEGGRNPTISPDGATLGYVRTGAAGDALASRPFAGGAERRLVAEGELLALAYPRFSPDGSRLAFAGIGELSRRSGMRLDIGEGRSGSPADGMRRRLALHGLPWDLFVVDVTGAGARRLAPVTEDDAAIAWSPDGGWIAVSGASGLRLVSVADGSERRLSTAASYGAIDWR